MKKESRAKKYSSDILAVVSSYGLTEEDLTDKSKLDEACIRYNADLALMKLKKRRGN